MSKHKMEVLACLDMLRNPVDTRDDAYRISMCIKNLYHDIERLCEERDDIKAKGIQEFAEKLEKTVVFMGFESVYKISVKSFDNLVQEMIGESNEMD